MVDVSHPSLYVRLRFRLIVDRLMGSNLPRSRTDKFLLWPTVGAFTRQVMPAPSRQSIAPWYILSPPLSYLILSGSSVSVLGQHFVSCSHPVDIHVLILHPPGFRYAIMLLSLVFLLSCTICTTSCFPSACCSLYCRCVTEVISKHFPRTRVLAIADLAFRLFDTTHTCRYTPHCRMPSARGRYEVLV